MQSQLMANHSNGANLIKHNQTVYAPTRFIIIIIAIIKKWKNIKNGKNIIIMSLLGDQVHT